MTNWDPTAKGAAITLSNGNLTARQTSDTGVDAAGRANVAITTGQKRYWEHAVNIVSDFNGPGLANATQTYPSSAYLGNSVNSIAYFQDGTSLYNNVATPGLETYTSGDTICVAVDFTAGKWWVRKNGGNWNNSGSANPATNTGGINIQVSGDVYPGYSLFKSVSSEAQCTANFGASAFAFTPPSGFVAFDRLGSAAITEANDTVASAGVLPITGQLARTEAGDTLTATGVLPIVGTLARTEAGDTLASAGVLPIVGTLAKTEANDTLSAAGGSTITGSASIQEAGDTLAATGTISGVQPGPVLKPGGIPSRGRKRRYERPIIRTYERDEDKAVAPPLPPPVKPRPFVPTVRPVSEADRVAYRARLDAMNATSAADQDDEEEEALAMLLAA